MKVIEDSNISYAWARAVRTALARKGEVSPLIISVAGDFNAGRPPNDQKVEEKLDVLLKNEGGLSINRVANTLFPQSLWNPLQPRARLYERYLQLWPKIKRSNPNGHYFRRLVSYGDAAVFDGNQLEFAISTYSSRKGVRRSMLQAAIFDPRVDHTKAAQRGFPCLQQVSFAVQQDKTIAINGFYAFQYIGKRAYGNYLGLCRLGHFVAHELNTTLSRMTCYSGIAQCDIGATKLRKVIDHLDDDVFERDSNEL